eukprot:SAG11_NODE_1801_length_4241_cov_7.942781_5_plen_114_part_00
MWEYSDVTYRTVREGPFSDVYCIFINTFQPYSIGSTRSSKLKLLDEFCDLLDLNLVPVDTVDLPSKKMHKSTSNCVMRRIRWPVQVSGQYACFLLENTDTHKRTKFSTLNYNA